MLHIVGLYSSILRRPCQTVLQCWFYNCNISSVWVWIQNQQFIIVLTSLTTGPKQPAFGCKIQFAKNTLCKKYTLPNVDQNADSTHHRPHTSSLWLVARASSNLTSNLHQLQYISLEQHLHVLNIKPDLIMELDNQLLDLGFLDHPPCQVVVRRVNEVWAPVIIRIIMLIIIIILLMILIMIYLSPRPQNLHMVCSAPNQSSLCSRSQYSRWS